MQLIEDKQVFKNEQIIKGLGAIGIILLHSNLAVSLHHISGFSYFIVGAFFFLSGYGLSKKYGGGYCLFVI